MIDGKDKKLLWALSENCRLSLAQLGRKVGISREVADYRVKRLEKEGIIKDYIAEINLDALGYNKSVVYLELRKVTSQREQEIIAYLTQHPYVSWLVSSTGKWSLIFDVHARDNKQLASIIDEIKTECKGNLGEYVIVTLQEYRYFHTKYFGEHKEMQHLKTSKEVSLDEKDLIILEKLAANGRMSYVQLAPHIKRTPEAASKRVKELQKSGVIKSFNIFPNLQQLGMEHYNVQIKYEHTGQKSEDSFINFLVHHSKVSFYYKPISMWDVEFGVFVKNPGELRQFMQEIRARFPDTIRIHDVILFYEEIKSNKLPTGVFKR